jgi:hypothetical protein
MMTQIHRLIFVSREDTRRNAKEQGNKKHLDKKLLEVQKPFLEKVSGRRRHK